MAVYRDKKWSVWRYRTVVRLPTGEVVERVSGTAKVNTREGAKESERLHINRVLAKATTCQKVEVPTFEAFAEQFLAVVRTRNKPSDLESKESTLRVHLKPFFAGKKLDEIGYAEIQDYAAAKLSAKKPLAKKSVNNHLTTLRRLLSVAKKRGVISTIPEFEWLKCPPQEFDFLAFDEADRLVSGADSQWGAMILVALRTGLRLGELLALRWEDVDLKKGVLRVARSVTRRIVTSPKSGKAREVPLGDEVLAALKEHRHLRGPLVFCGDDGRMLEKNEVKHPLRRAHKRAGLRHVHWHMLRHTFASHLVMRGAPIKAVQELLGHATLDMTMRYAHLSPNVPRDAVKLLDGVTKSCQNMASAGVSG